MIPCGTHDVDLILSNVHNADDFFSTWLPKFGLFTIGFVILAVGLITTLFNAIFGRNRQTNVA